MKANKTLFFTLFIIAIVPQNLLGQFFFPSLPVLHENNVRKLAVFRSQVRFQGGPERSREGLIPDTNRVLISVYHFNVQGGVDSLVKYPYGNSYKQKVHFIHDSLGRIIEVHSFNHEGLKVGVVKVFQRADGMIYYQSFIESRLRKEMRAHSDSVVYEILDYPQKDSLPLYRTTYDRTKKLKTEHWKSPTDAYQYETFQWFVKDGKPDSFRYTNEEKKTGKKVTTLDKTFPLDSSGNVVTRYLGRFDDPFLRYNYFERYEKIPLLKYPDQRRFRREDLFPQIEVPSLYTFDGVELVYLYELVYYTLE